MSMHTAHDHRETYPNRPVYLVQSKSISSGEWKGVLTYECKACAVEHAEAIAKHSATMMARVVAFGA